VTSGRLLAVACAIGLSAGPAVAKEGDRLLDVTFDRYYDAAALAATLKRVHEAYPTWTRLEEMGKSREGRPLWVMTVFVPSGPPLASRPAMYVDGNTHGNEAQCTEVCLFTIKYLLTRDDPWVAALVKRAAFHVAPCVNPDSRERFLHAAFDEHSPRGVPRPVDDDRDGLVDEDGPNDLDGDGEILSMRVKDPNGDTVVDERDDRLVRPRKPGEAGRYRMLGREGIDDDGDGEVNEDGIGAVDPNRNWPSEWRPEPEQHGAGPYPLSEPETRATALWILAHPRIAAVQSYHNAGQMILRPPASKTDKEAELPREDEALYDEIGRRGGILLPGYRYMQIREDLYKVHGGFVDWTYGTLGVFSFTNELWGLWGWGTDNDAKALEPLRWNDVALHGAGFVRWHEVKHPTFGTVEVGGWRRFTTRNTPVDFLPDLCLRNCLFTLEHASTMPDVVVTSATRAEGGRVVRVVVGNRALLPTISAWAQKHRLLPPDEVWVDGAAVLAAAEVLPGRPPAPLPVREGRARLETGVRGESSRTIDLHLAPGARATRVVFSSRLGGEASAAVR
jgi:hypothetical protein